MIHIKKIWPGRWVYWGHETIYPDWEKCDVAEQFWWVEDVYPFRLGNGWRFKESPFKAFHFGFAKVSSVDSHEEVIGSRDLSDYTPEEIREWNGTTNQAPEATSDAGSSRDDGTGASEEDALGRPVAVG